MADEQERKLFVRGLNKVTDDDQLKHFFETYGNIVDCSIMRDQEKRSRGFGFILFDDTAAVDKIIAAKKEGHVFSLDDHSVEVKRALPKIPRGGAPRAEGLHKKVFVGGLPSTITEEDVREYFENFGRVNEVQLIKDRETGRPRGFAFLTFDEEDSADKCLQRRSHEICKKNCEVKRAQSRIREQDHANGTDRRLGTGNFQKGQENAAGAGGVLGMNDVNRLIQQAFVMGQGLYQQPSVQPAPAPAPSVQPSNILLQALTAQQVSTPAAAPVAVANTSTLSQLTQLLQAGGIDANSLGTLLKTPQLPQTPQVPSTSIEVYSTPFSTYVSPPSKYRTSKDEYSEKRTKRAYRPY